jgi:hypothetical protein
MKKSAVFLASTIVLTLLFYLVAYFYLPPPPPSGSMMVLFAGVAAVLVWLLQLGFRKARSRKTGRVVLLLISVAFQSGLALCHPSQATALFRAQVSPSEKVDAPPAMMTVCGFNAGPRAGTTQSYVSTLRVGSACSDGAGSTGVIIRASKLGGAGGEEGISPVSAMPEPDRAQPNETTSRVTGTALLVHKQNEESGYGLYSYALLAHAPEDSELPKYRAFFKALTLELPSASDLAEYLPKNRINITYMLLKSLPSDWKTQSNSAQVEYVISHYDYARCAAMLASLPQHTGTGPVIASSLAPMSLSQRPHPV